MSFLIYDYCQLPNKKSFIFPTQMVYFGYHLVLWPVYQAMTAPRYDGHLWRMVELQIMETGCVEWWSFL